MMHVGGGRHGGGGGLIPLDPPMQGNSFMNNMILQVVAYIFLISEIP